VPGIATLLGRTAISRIIRARSGDVGACVLSLLVASCASTGASARPVPRRSDVPLFQGVETDYWLAEETEPVGRDDILPAFRASARNYGCGTEQLGNEHSANIVGEMRGYYGITASCDEGTIALITLVGGRVSIGCAKPTTHQACDALLRNISQAR